MSGTRSSSTVSSIALTRDRTRARAVSIVVAYQKHGKDSWLSIARDVISKFKADK